MEKLKQAIALDRLFYHLGAGLSGEFDDDSRLSIPLAVSVTRALRTLALHNVDVLGVKLVEGQLTITDELFVGTSNADVDFVVEFVVSDTLTITLNELRVITHDREFKASAFKSPELVDHYDELTEQLVFKNVDLGLFDSPKSVLTAPATNLVKAMFNCDSIYDLDAMVNSMDLASPVDVELLINKVPYCTISKGALPYQHDLPMCLDLFMFVAILFLNNIPGEYTTLNLDMCYEEGMFAVEAF